MEHHYRATMPILSIRQLKRRRLPWHAFVFWVWLFGFVFSFAASDLFHGPNCPEQLALRQAALSHQHAALHAPSALEISQDSDCAACAFQHAALAIVPTQAWSFPPAVADVPVARFSPVLSCSFSLTAIARGPPCSLRV